MRLGKITLLKTLPFSSDNSLNLCSFMQIDFSCSIDYEVTGTSGELERRTYEARTFFKRSLKQNSCWHQVHRIVSQEHASHISSITAVIGFPCVKSLICTGAQHCSVRGFILRWCIHTGLHKNSDRDYPRQNPLPPARYQERSRRFCTRKA